MREIKFRAWDTKLNYMLNMSHGDSVGGLWRNGLSYPVEWEQFSLLHYIIEESAGLGEGAIGDYEPGRYILEQYTGLKDKNGKEIYEGDIMAWRNGSHCDACGTPVYTDRVEIVMWGNSGWLPFEESDGYDYIIMIDHYCGEVIGNIHENKEVLP